MKQIYVNFVDFWGDFDVHSNFILDVLSVNYEVIISKNPDYLFFSCFGTSHLSYKCVKILFLGENLTPDFNLCDYAIGFDYLSFGDRYLRLPLYVTYSSFEQLKKTKEISEEAVLKRSFCSIVVSNKGAADPKRERFFKLLSEYKKVDSGGRAWNNVGGPIKDKLDFIGNYKFNIAFENSCVLGYTTEKIMEPMTVNTLPIYWGNPLVEKDFNPASFINAHDYPTLEKLVEYVVHLDTSDNDYIHILKQPCIIGGKYLDWREVLLDFISKIIEKPFTESKYLVDYGCAKNYREDLIIWSYFYNKLNMRKLTSLYRRLISITK